MTTIRDAYMKDKKRLRSLIWKWPEREEIWKYKYPLDEKGEVVWDKMMSPYDQEHIDLVNAIRANNPYVEAEQTAKSTMAAIMGRMSAYTGKVVTWDEVMNSDLKLGPETLSFGKVNIVKEVPIPGTV